MKVQSGFQSSEGSPLRSLFRKPIGGRGRSGRPGSIVMGLLWLGVMLLPGSVADSQEPAAAVDWTLISPGAPWSARDSMAELVFDDKIWILGGWLNSHSAPPRDVWSSADGKQWNQVTHEAPWIHSDFSMAVTFRERMWFMGGWYNGRLPDHSASNQVWSSRNGRNWRQETKNASWTPRSASAVVEFQGKMWLLGGTENYYFGDQSSLRNDVWSSTDGKDWQLVTEQAPWAPRAYHKAAVLNDRLYLYGGGNYVPEYAAFNDVWSTADGVKWRQETESAGWSPRLWFSAVAYRDHLWMLGGWSNHPDTNYNDVWYSRDGKVWKQLKTPTIWSTRHAQSAVIHRDRIWLMGGHARPLANDVWTLQLPPDWSGE